jgi:tetratricopeptide (TPR) repeat protein
VSTIEQAAAVAKRRRTKVGMLARELKGDLDWVILRAIEKDRDRRYESAAALADDVKRHLNAQPILARAPSTVYQLKKLVARHKTAFGFTVVLFVVLLGSALTMGILYEGQRRESERAQGQARKAQRISSFIQEMLSSASPELAQGREVTVRELLDEAAKTVEGELAEEPEVRAAIQTTIAESYARLLHPAQAIPQFEAAYRTLRVRYGESDGRVLRAKLTLAWNASWETGRKAEGEQMIREVIDAAGRSLGANDPLVGDALFQLARIRATLGHNAEAESLLQRALEIHRETATSGDEGLVSLLKVLGDIRLGNDNHGGARAAYTESLALARGIRGKDDMETAHLVERIAYTWSQDNPAKADSFFSEGLRLARAVAGGDHPTIAMLLKNAGVRLVGRGNLEGAAGCFLESWQMRQRLFGEENVQPGTSMTNLAEVRHVQGRLEEAKRCYLRALHHFGWGNQPAERADISSPTDMVAWALRGYAELLLEQGDLDDAERAFREGVAIAERSDYSDPFWVADARLRLGHCLALRGRLEQAESLMVTSNATLQDAPPGYWLQGGSPYWGDFRSSALERMADLHERLGEPTQASAYRAELMRSTEAAELRIGQRSLSPSPGRGHGAGSR